MVWIFLVLVAFTVLLSIEESFYAEGFIFLTVFIGIALIIMVGIFISYSTVQEKISLYEQENEKIEKSVQTFVEEYLDYEREIFSLDVEMILSFPEIKGNELMLKQIETFIENRKTIVKLKEQKILYNLWSKILFFYNKEENKGENNDN